MLTKVEISTRLYESNFGRKPRGFGLWYFRVSNGVLFTHAGTFVEAKRAARHYVRQQGNMREAFIQLCG